MKRLCLVSPGHPASNPRLVKEAAALHGAGYNVTVVCGRYFPGNDPLDRPIFESSPWRWKVVDYSRGTAALAAKLRRRLTLRALHLGAPVTLRLARWGHHAAIGLLARAASRVPADLYIGHTVAGLAAAATAACANGARLGFDAEDFHPGESARAAEDAVGTRLIGRIESAWLPRCAHRTAAAPLIAEAYASTYRLPVPVTVLNVFPLTEAPPAPVAPARPHGVPQLYWFSQTVGPGRGLEQLIVTLGAMKQPCELRLRGWPASGYSDALQRHAAQAGFRGRLIFDPPAPSAQMATLAAACDLGLSLEEAESTNRDLCLTNKIFTYLLAGVPQLLTPTRAQRTLAPELGAAAILLTGDTLADAARLDAYLADPAAQTAARAAAWRLGQTRYHWEKEREHLLASVARALA